MSKNRGMVGFFYLLFLMAVFFPGSHCRAAEANTSPSPEAMEIKILHVDKLAIYAPGLVIYWDAAMSKQKLAGLTSTAEKLRNKKALITYLTTEDDRKKKRLVLVDLAPAKEESHEVARAPAVELRKPPAESPQVARERQPEPMGRDSATATREATTEAQPPPSAIPEAPIERPRLPAAVEPIPERSLRPSDSELPLAKLDRPTDTAQTITKDEVARFIEGCIGSVRRKDMDASMACYADRVDYYNRGMVNRDYIRRDKGYFFRNWDRVDSSLDGGLVFIVTDQHDVRIVKFISNYYVESSKKSLGGKAENIWTIQKTGNTLKIIDEKQKVLSTESRRW